MELGRGVRKLLIRIFFVFFPVLLVWLYVWMCPMRYMDKGLASFYWTREQAYTASEKNYDVIILGDSVGNSAYIPELLSEKTINLALPGQTPVEQYYILKNYLKNHKPPRICYITFLDGHLMNTEDSFYWRTLCSHVLNVEEEYEIFTQAREMGYTNLLKDGYVSDWAGYRLRSIEKYTPALINSGFGGRLQINRNVLWKMGIHRGTFYAKELREFNEQNDTHTAASFKMSPFTELYLEKIFMLCSEYGVKIRFVHLNRMDVEYSEKYLHDFQASFNDKQKYNTNSTLLVLDKFLIPEDLADKWHLNNHGANRFSRYIKQQYPEDFADDTPVSRDTIAGLSDYIAVENSPDMLLWWIREHDFSAIFIVRKNGDLLSNSSLRDVIENGGYHDAFMSPAFTSYGNRCYYFTGDHHTADLAAEGNSVVFKEDGWNGDIIFTDKQYSGEIKLPNEEQTRKIFKNNATALSVVILNNYDKKVVAVKNFVLLHNVYTIMK